MDALINDMIGSVKVLERQVDDLQTLEAGAGGAGRTFPLDPVTGQIYYHTDLDEWFVWNGTGRWVGEPIVMPLLTRTGSRTLAANGVVTTIFPYFSTWYQIDHLQCYLVTATPQSAANYVAITSAWGTLLTILSGAPDSKLYTVGGLAMRFWLEPIGLAAVSFNGVGAASPGANRPGETITFFGAPGTLDIDAEMTVRRVFYRTSFTNPFTTSLVSIEGHDWLSQLGTPTFDANGLFFTTVVSGNEYFFQAPKNFDMTLIVRGDFTSGAVRNYPLIKFRELELNYGLFLNFSANTISVWKAFNDGSGITFTVLTGSAALAAFVSSTDYLIRVVINEDFIAVYLGGVLLFSYNLTLTELPRYNTARNTKMTFTQSVVGAAGNLARWKNVSLVPYADGNLLWAVLDRFDRADNLLVMSAASDIPAWEAVSGTAGIVAGRGYFPSDGNLDRVRTNIFTKNFTGSIELNGQYIAGGGNYRIPFIGIRAQGVGAFFAIGLQDNLIYIQRRNANATFISTAAVSGAVTTTDYTNYTLTVSANENVITASMNGVSVSYTLVGAEIAANNNVAATYLFLFVAKAGTPTVGGIASFDNLMLLPL